MKNYLLLLLLFTVIFANTQEDTDSVIKLIREDDFIATFSVFANDMQIGTLAENATINWKQKPGELTILLQAEQAEIPIELHIQPHYLYEIYFKADSYTVRSSRIAPSFPTPKKRIPFYYFMVPVFLVVIIYFVLDNLNAKRNYLLGKKYLKKGKYPEAIIVFQRLIRSHRKNCEFWNDLEIAYISNSEFDKANICKENIKKLLDKKQIKSEHEKDYPTLQVIKHELNKKYLKLAKINPVEKIDKGKSNFGKYLVEVITQETFITCFAVLKLPDKSAIYKQNDLLREAVGYQYFKKQWKQLLERHIPKDVVLISTSKSDVLFSFYAEESKTKEVKTLLTALDTNFNKTLSILNKMRSLYLEKYRTLNLQHKRNRRIFLHLKETFADKWNNITTFNWDDFGIDTQKKLINIHGTLLPNAIYYLLKQNLWNDKNFSLSYDVLHGDLNPENCMITSTGNFVFIDFEKVGEKPFFYDLSFLSVWFLQHFVLEKYSNVMENLNPIHQSIYDFMTDSQSLQPISSQLATIYSVYQNIFPQRENMEENEQTGLDISFVCALILRAYYELRDSEKDNRKLHTQNGLFLYSFACFWLKKCNLIAINDAKISNAFDFPVTTKK